MHCIRTETIEVNVHACKIFISLIALYKSSKKFINLFSVYTKNIKEKSSMKHTKQLAKANKLRAFHGTETYKQNNVSTFLKKFRGNYLTSFSNMHFIYRTVKNCKKDLAILEDNSIV